MEHLVYQWAGGARAESASSYPNRPTALRWYIRCRSSKKTTGTSLRERRIIRFS